MDEKKVREAIGKLQVGIQGKREKIKFNKAFYPKQDNIQLEEDITVYEIAIEALEKQLPKKPIEKGIHFVYYKCPNCNRILPIDKNYCDCGQRLDWPEE